MLLLRHALTPLLDDRTHELRYLYFPSTLTRPGHLTWAARVNEKRVTCLASVEVRALQHVVDSLGVHPERASDPDGGQLAVVHQPVHRHLADPHQARHLGDGQKLSSWRLTIGRAGVTRRLSTSRIPRRWPVHRRHRNPIHQALAVPAASPPLHQPVLTTGRIAWPMGLLRRVWAIRLEINELL